MVASWVFCACGRILDVTATQYLSSHIEASLKQLRRSTQLQSALVRHTNESESGNPHGDLPRRTSSLSFRSPTVLSVPAFSPPAQTIGASMRLPSTLLPHGASDLAGLRGDLISVARRTLSDLGWRLRTWSTGSATGLGLSKDYSDLQEVDLKGEATDTCPSETAQLDAQAIVYGVCNPTLVDAISRKEKFLALYEVSRTMSLQDLHLTIH